MSVNNSEDPRQDSLCRQAFALCEQAMELERPPAERVELFIKAMALNASLKHDDPRHEYLKILYYTGRCQIPGEERLFGPGMAAVMAAYIARTNWALPPAWHQLQVMPEAEQLRKAS